MGNYSALAGSDCVQNLTDADEPREFYHKRSSGIDDMHSENILVFPNPAGDYVNILFRSDQNKIRRRQDLSWGLLTPDGVTVMSGKYSGMLRIDIRSLTQRTYLWVLKAEKFNNISKTRTGNACVHYNKMPELIPYFEVILIAIIIIFYCSHSIWRENIQSYYRSNRRLRNSEVQSKSRLQDEISKLSF